MCKLTLYFIPSLYFIRSILCVSIFIVWLNKKFILIKKLGKHNQINISYYKIKYLMCKLVLYFIQGLYFIQSYISIFNIIWLNKKI
jgi:hypothetical protein